MVHPPEGFLFDWKPRSDRYLNRRERRRAREEDEISGPPLKYLRGAKRALTSHSQFSRVVCQITEHESSVRERVRCPCYNFLCSSDPRRAHARVHHARSARFLPVPDDHRSANKRREGGRRAGGRARRHQSSRPNGSPFAVAGKGNLYFQRGTYINRRKARGGAGRHFPCERSRPPVVNGIRFG